MNACRAAPTRRRSSACRAIVLLAITGIALGPLRSAHAQDARAFTAADTQAIEQLARDYFHAFTVKNFAAFPKYFTAPFVLFRPQPLVLPTVEDVIRTWHQVRDPLDKTDYALSRIIQMHVVPLTPRTAMINIHWQRLTHAGTVLSEGAEFYFLIKREGNWRIDGNIGQQLALYQDAR